MKFWNDLDGAIFLNKIFSVSVPIKFVELSVVNIDNDKNNIAFGFDIEEIPDIIPDKWLKKEFNTCRLGLEFGEVSELLIENIPTTKKLAITITELKNNYLISISNDDSSIRFFAKFIFLRGPTVYLNAARM